MERERTMHPPRLLVSHGQNHDQHSFYNVANKRFHTKSIHELSDKCIYSTDGCDGWLALVDAGPAGGEACLWNPESKAKIELPVLQNLSDEYYIKCLLSKPPTDPDCHILFYSPFFRAFCKVGDNEFVKEQHSMEEGKKLLAAVSFDGNIYGLVNYDSKHEIVTVHFVENIIEFRPIMKEEDGEQEPWEIDYEYRSYITRIESYLMESPLNKNQLLLVNKMYSRIYYDVGFDFKIFTLDLSQMEYEEVENLGDYTIFVGDYNKDVCSRFIKGIKPNSIYYTDPNGRNLCIFDINDKGRTVLLPCPSARRSESMNYWIEQGLMDNLYC